MNNKEKLEELHNTALAKFSLYLQAVYELSQHKTNLTISKREEAKKEWQKAINEYNNLLSFTKQAD